MRSHRVVAYLAVLLALISWTPSSAQAHPLGFSTAELRFVDGAFEIEWVLDAPGDEPRPTPALRKQLLLQAVRDALTVRFEPGAHTVAQQAKVLALGDGPSAVDVVSLRGMVPDGAARVQVGVAETAGDVALEIRTLSGESGFAELVAAGRQSPWVTLDGVPPAASGSSDPAAHEVAAPRVETAEAPTTAAGNPPRASHGVDRNAVSVALLFLAALLITVSTAAGSNEARREILACLLGALLGANLVAFFEAALALEPSYVVLVVALLVGVPWWLRPHLEAKRLRYLLSAVGATFGAALAASLAENRANFGWANLVASSCLLLSAAIAWALSGPASLPLLARIAARRLAVGVAWGLVALWAVLQWVFAS